MNGPAPVGRGKRFSKAIINLSRTQQLQHKKKLAASRFFRTLEHSVSVIKTRENAFLSVADEFWNAKSAIEFPDKTQWKLTGGKLKPL